MRLVLILAAWLPLGAADLSSALQSVEKKYNKIKTLEIQFEQTSATQGRPRKTESGRLLLRKPGQMRWEYAEPAGKLLVADNKNVYFYSPATHRVERSKLRDLEDFRAPLAFLLGKLDFSRDFQDFTAAEEGDLLQVTALPKSDQLPYSKVQFTLSKDSTIQRLVVTGQDGSTLDFHFRSEKVNPPLAESLFRFVTPTGAELVEVN